MYSNFYNSEHTITEPQTNKRSAQSWFQLVSVCLGLKSCRFTQWRVKANRPVCLRLPRLHRPGRDTRGFAHNALCPQATLTRSGTADLQHSEPDQSRDALQSGYDQNFTANTLTDNGTQNQTTEECGFSLDYRTSHTSFDFIMNARYMID